MRYEFIESNRSYHRVKKMCTVLKVCESGYYRWRKRVPGKREVEDSEIVKEMREIHEENFRTYGAVKIMRALKKKRVECGIGRIYRLMRENGIYTVHRCKHRPYPKEVVEARYNENLLEQKFEVDAPDEVWAGDITYIKTDFGWVYMAMILDLFNREVIGYALGRKANTELVRIAMDQALLRRNRPRNVVFHSDRGCQYSSKTYQDYLERNGITGSMSRKGNPYDNACSESFFATIKKEWIYFRRYSTMTQVDSSVFQYVELFYNRRRMHESLGYLSPKQYLEKHIAAKTA
jgi:transposase InsO family protein